MHFLGGFTHFPPLLGTVTQTPHSLTCRHGTFHLWAGHLHTSPGTPRKSSTLAQSIFHGPCPSWKSLRVIFPRCMLRHIPVIFTKNPARIFAARIFFPALELTQFPISFFFFVVSPPPLHVQTKWRETTTTGKNNWKNDGEMHSGKIGDRKIQIFREIVVIFLICNEGFCQKDDSNLKKNIFLVECTVWVNYMIWFNAVWRRKT